MYKRDGDLFLSPSDVTAFLACEHLTTLSIAHARGEIERPAVENEQVELIFRRGLEHERVYLESLRGEVVRERVQDPPPLPSGAGEQVFRTLPVANASLRDWLGPHDARVYRLRLRL